MDPRLEGFMRRRAKGAGFFFTPHQIDSSRTRTLADLLRSGTTADLVPGSAGQVHLASRSAQLGVGGLCWAQIYLDGTLIYSPLNIAKETPPDLRDFHTENLEAVEYYTQPGETPVQFRSSAPVCGTLVLWSRMH